MIKINDIALDRVTGGAGIEPSAECVTKAEKLTFQQYPELRSISDTPDSIVFNKGAIAMCQEMLATAATESKSTSRR